MSKEIPQLQPPELTEPSLDMGPGVQTCKGLPSGKLLRAALTGTLLLAGCGEMAPLPPTVGPDGTATPKARSTEISTATATATFTPTSTPTPTETATATATTPEIIWKFNDPEVLPNKPFEYLASTEFAQQVLDWEAQGGFPEVPDTAVPIKTIEIGIDTDKAILKKYGFVPIYDFPEIPSNPVGYKGSLKKIPYTLAGVWKTEYLGESAFFILKKWKNPDGSAGFEGYIYETRSTNPKAITWELIDNGFGNENRYSTGDYFLKSTEWSHKPSGLSFCGVYFRYFGGNPNSKFCTWYYDNPDLVFNKELYYRWQRTGILSNYITENGKKVPFIPISPMTSLPFTSDQ